MESELERQRNLVNARNQLQGLQDLWPRLVGRPRAVQAQSAEKRAAPHRRLKRGQRTPKAAFVLPILHAVEELGGRGAVADVLERAGERLSDRLNEHDHKPLRNGQIAWRNAAHWARVPMVEEGLLAGDSPRGRAYLREHAAEMAAL